MVQVTPQPTPNPHAYKFTLIGHRFDAPLTINAGNAAGTPFEGIFLKKKQQRVKMAFNTAMNWWL